MTIKIPSKTAFEAFIAFGVGLPILGLGRQLYPLVRKISPKYALFYILALVVFWFALSMRLIKMVSNAWYSKLTPEQRFQLTFAKMTDPPK